MIKTISKDGTAYGGFKYPLRKGAIIKAPDWNSEPVCGGGLHGLIHETEDHYIENHGLWIILEYKKGTEVFIDNNKIKVPEAKIIDWGEAGYIQELFAKLTVKQYQYDFAIQTAGNVSTQTAGYRSTQIAGYRSTQIAGNVSTQIAGDISTQIAGDISTQIAGDGSVSIIRGKIGYMSHKKHVLQVMVFWDEKEKDYIFLTKEIHGSGEKHKIEAIKKDGKWEMMITKEGK